MIGILAANFYPKSATRSAVVDLNRIVDGRRTNIVTFRVATKREARELAERYGAKPWNF